MLMKDTTFIGTWPEVTLKRGVTVEFHGRKYTVLDYYDDEVYLQPCEIIGERSPVYDPVGILLTSLRNSGIFPK